jgi:hypothetical protein
MIEVCEYFALFDRKDTLDELLTQVSGDTH